ncbi:MAG: hypothetical protein GY701_28860 [Sulfitobacter sp.]|nr:hypothetical protein [Sulfitobacter sp.]
MSDVTIDGVIFTPKKRLGARHIVVLDRGWIFVGDLSRDEDGNYRLTNAANIRKWSSGGFGGLTRDPKGSGAVLDPSEDLRFDATAPLFTVPVEDSWNE